MASRVGFVPLPGATLEIVLTTQAASLSTFQPAFGSLLTSFHQISGQAR
jgi:uncharacterized protein (DUF697 family)